MSFIIIWSSQKHLAHSISAPALIKHFIKNKKTIWGNIFFKSLKLLFQQDFPVISFGISMPMMVRMVGTMSPVFRFKFGEGGSIVYIKYRNGLGMLRVGRAIADWSRCRSCRGQLWVSLHNYFQPRFYHFAHADVHCFAGFYCRRKYTCMSHHVGIGENSDKQNPLRVLIRQRSHLYRECTHFRLKIIRGHFGDAIMMRFSPVNSFSLPPLKKKCYVRIFFCFCNANLF